jgi:hypothetical protein
MPMIQIGYLLGHKQDNVTGDVYVKSTSLEQKREALLKLDFII